MRDEVVSRNVSVQLFLYARRLKLQRRKLGLSGAPIGPFSGKSLIGRVLPNKGDRAAAFARQLSVLQRTAQLAFDGRRHWPRICRPPRIHRWPLYRENGHRHAPESNGGSGSPRETRRSTRSTARAHPTNFRVRPSRVVRGAQSYDRGSAHSRHSTACLHFGRSFGSKREA